MNFFPFLVRSKMQPAVYELEANGNHSAFGELSAIAPWAVIQCDAVYGLLSGLTYGTTLLGGSATTNNGLFQTGTGTTQYGYGVIQSRQRMRYRPGQGMLGRFTAMFTSPVANSICVVGFGHSESGIFIGFNGTTPGILYSLRGVREVRTLTVTVASSHTENVTVTLNGVATSVAVTNSGNIQRTVWEIASGTYPGWRACPEGATVVFLRGSNGPAAGAYSLSGTSAAGTFAQTKAGVLSTDTWIPQTTWNGDKLNGDGPSGVTIDWTKLNVFVIQLKYLGAGAMKLFCEVIPPGSGESKFVRCHTIEYPNNYTLPNFDNPSFPFTIASYSAGSTTDLVTSSSSFSSFVEGPKKITGLRFCYNGESITVGSAAYTAIYTILNNLTFKGRTNQGVVNLMSISIASKHTRPCTVYLFRSNDSVKQVLVGNPNFVRYATSSVTSVDTTATAFTITDNTQLIWAGTVGDSGQLSVQLNDDQEQVTLEPGEFLSVCARTTSGSPTAVAVSLVTREDI